MSGLLAAQASLVGASGGPSSFGIKREVQWYNIKGGHFKIKRNTRACLAL